MSNNFRDTAHSVAGLVAVELTDTESVLDAIEAERTYSQMKREPEPASLSHILAGLPVKDWPKATEKHTASLARYNAIRAAGTDPFTRAVNQAVRDAADEYLQQIAPAVQHAADQMIDAAQHISTRDHAESIHRMEGAALGEFERGVVIIGSYAGLCATLVRSIKSNADRGLAVFGELAVVHPGDIPTEVRDQQSLNHKTTNPMVEQHHIHSARDAMRAPRTSVSELIAKVAMGSAHDRFSIHIPTTTQGIHDTLTAWDGANRVRWSDE